MIGKLIGKLVVWGLLAIVIGVIALGGYFYYKAGQPMQVAEAQRLAPGITYREYWADRIQRWGEIDDQKEAQGKGRACVITGRVTFTYWLWGSILVELGIVKLARRTGRKGISKRNRSHN